MRRSDLIIYLGALVILAAIVTTSVFDIGNDITNTIMASTAVIGALGIYMTFRKDKKISQATFMTTFSYQFYDQAELKAIMSKLEKYRRGNKACLTEKDYDDIVAYLQWCEELASLINNKVFSFDTIDDLFSYRFFLITNNEYVQKTELIPEKEFYRAIFTAYEAWTKYKNKKNLPIMMADTPLIRV